MVFIEIGAGTEMLKQGCQDKRKQIETMLLRYQPSVTCNPQTALKSTFDFTEIVNEWTWNRGTVCHFVRFISQLSQELHIQILNCIHSEFICSVAKDYHENSKLKDSLAKNFWLGFLSDFKMLPRIYVGSAKAPMEEFIFQ